MKKLAIIAAALLVTASAFAQGTVNFRNRATASGINSPVVTQTGANAVGPNIVAQLFIGAAGAGEGALTAVGTPSALLTGAGAGYFQGGVLTIPNFAGGTQVAAQVRVWDTTTGATWDAASVKGASSILSLTLGNAGSPPSVPSELSGLSGNITLVPEPSTMALALLGGLALLFRRRK